VGELFVLIECKRYSAKRHDGSKDSAAHHLARSERSSGKFEPLPLFFATDQFGDSIGKSFFLVRTFIDVCPNHS
jgi:hypothetical protein